MQMTTPTMMTRRGAGEVGYYTCNNSCNHSGLSEDRHRTANDDISIVDADEIVATATVFHSSVIVEDCDDVVTQGTIATASNTADGTPTITASICSSSTVYWTPPSTERIRNIIPTLSLPTWDGPNLPMFPSLDDDDDDGFAVATWNDTGSNANSNSHSNTDVAVVSKYNHTCSSDTDVVVDLPEATVIQVYDDDTDVWYEASEFISTPTPTSITRGHSALASNTTMTTTTTTTTSSSPAPTAHSPNLVNTRRNLTPVFEILAEVSTAAALDTEGMIKTKTRKI